MYLDTTIFVPIVIPLNKDINKNMTLPVAPTAAKAVDPENFPTTIVSAALNTICRQFVNINGTENANKFLIRFPCVKSI